MNARQRLLPPLDRCRGAREMPPSDGQEVVRLIVFVVAFLPAPRPAGRPCNKMHRPVPSGDSSV